MVDSAESRHRRMKEMLESRAFQEFQEWIYREALILSGELEIKSESDEKRFTFAAYRKAVIAGLISRYVAFINNELDSELRTAKQENDKEPTDLNLF